MIHLIQETAAELAEKTIFGAASARSGFSGDLLQLNIPNLKAVEVPANQILNKEIFQRFSTVHAGSLLEPEIAENLLTSGKKLQENSLIFLRQSIETLADSGITTGSLDLNLTLEHAAEALHMLKALTPLLYEKKFTILLPFTVPVRKDFNAAIMMQFLRHTLNPFIRLRLDVHIHECKPNETPQALAGTVLSEVRSVHFIFHADAGNQLLAEHLQPWIRALAVYGFNGPFFTAPVSETGEHFALHAEHFSKITEFKQNK